MKTPDSSWTKLGLITHIAIKITDIKIGNRRDPTSTSLNTPYQRIFIFMHMVSFAQLL